VGSQNSLALVCEHVDIYGDRYRAKNQLHKRPDCDRGRSHDQPTTADIVAVRWAAVSAPNGGSAAVAAAYYGVWDGRPLAHATPSVRLPGAARILCTLASNTSARRTFLIGTLSPKCTTPVHRSDPLEAHSTRGAALHFEGVNRLAAALSAWTGRAQSVPEWNVELTRDSNHKAYEGRCGDSRTMGQVVEAAYGLRPGCLKDVDLLTTETRGIHSLMANLEAYCSDGPVQERTHQPHSNGRRRRPPRDPERATTPRRQAWARYPL
jgi:hypothetical protein